MFPFRACRYLSAKWLSWRNTVREILNSPSRAWDRDTALKQRYPHDICAVLNLRLAGVQVMNTHPDWPRRRILRLCLVACLPLMASLVLQLFRPAPGRLALSYFGWQFYFAALTVGTVLACWTGCILFYRLTADLNSALSTQGLATYHAWADRKTRFTPQFSWALAVATLAAIALWIATRVPGMSRRLYVTPTSYFAVFQAAFFVAGGIYWIGHGTVLARHLSRPSCMRLSWAAPARTPGIERLAQCYREGFYIAMVGSALCLTPWLYWAYGGPDSPKLLIVKASLLLISVSATLFLAVLPQWWLSEAVARTRRATIRELTSRLPSTAADVDLSDRELSTLQGLIKLVSDSPATTVSERTIAALMLGATTALIPYFLQFAG